MSRAPDAVCLWINTTFRDVLFDDEFMLRTAAVMKAGTDRGQDWQKILRITIASAVMDAAGMDPDQW